MHDRVTYIVVVLMISGSFFFMITSEGETMDDRFIINSRSPFVGEGENDSFSIVLLPDTQIYSRSYPAIFTNQTEWIRDHRYEFNIRYVLHEGDITNNNNIDQWENANTSMRVLDGFVPYTLLPGNHDLGPNGNAANRDTYLNDYFPSPQFENWSTFGGAFEKGKLENTYHLFSDAGLDWMIVSLEMAPRDTVLDWANGVISAYPDRLVMVVTHNYMAGNQRNNWLGGNYGIINDPDGANNGEDIWQKCIKLHRNVISVFSGHILVEYGYLASTGNNGNIVHQMMANFQMNANGGDGFLRLLTFNTTSGTIKVKTYSPYKEEYKTEINHDFELSFNRWKYVNYPPFVSNPIDTYEMKEDQLRGCLGLDGRKAGSNGIFSDPDHGYGDSMRFQMNASGSWDWLDVGESLVQNSKLFTLMANGTLKIEAPEDHFCDEIIELRAVDSIGEMTEHSLRLVIENVNDPPVIGLAEDWIFEDPPEDVRGTIITILEDEPVNMTVVAHDPVEPWDEANFHFSSNASEDNAPFFNIDPLTGLIAFTPSNEDVGVHFITIFVDDGNEMNNISSLDIKLEIVNVNDPPVITNDNVVQAWEDVEYIVDYEAIDIDPDGDDLTWVLISDAKFLSIDRETGILRGKPTDDDVGIFNVSITVKDGEGASDIREFYLTVHNVNDPPISMLEEVTFYFLEDTEFEFTLDDRFLDVDNDLVYSTSEGVNISPFLYEDRIIFAPDPDWNGEETFFISASDGNETASMNLTLVVEAVNDMPVDPMIILMEDEYIEGGSQWVSGTGEDPDLIYGDTMEMRWTSNVSGYLGSGEQINLSLHSGYHLVTLRIKDSSNEWNETSVEIFVKEGLVEDDDTKEDDDDEDETTGSSISPLIYIIFIVGLILLGALGIFLLFTESRILGSDDDEE